MFVSVHITAVLHCSFLWYFSVILAIGVKESSIINNIFTGVNLLVVTYVVICGLFKVDFHNWSLPSAEVRVIVLRPSHLLYTTDTYCLSPHTPHQHQQIPTVCPHTHPTNTNRYLLSVPPHTPPTPTDTYCLSPHTSPSTPGCTCPCQGQGHVKQASACSSMEESTTGCCSALGDINKLSIRLNNFHWFKIHEYEQMLLNSTGGNTQQTGARDFPLRGIPGKLGQGISRPGKLGQGISHWGEYPANWGKGFPTEGNTQQTGARDFPL